VTETDTPVLVTGATGRLGRRLLPLLAESGRFVRALVIPDDPGVRALAALGVETHVSDLVEPSPELDAAVAGVGAVIHAAARLPGPGSTDRVCFESIVSGTFNLLEAVVAGAAPKPRFVYVSSTAVYGPQLPPDFSPITEEHPVRPTSVYGAAKAAAEVFVEAYGRRHGVRHSVVRPSDIVTADDFSPERGFVAKRFRFDLDEATIAVSVDEGGEAITRSFASARDVARGIVEVLRHERAIGEVFHVGPLRSSSDLEVAGAIARRRGLRVLTVAGAADLPSWVISSDKADRLLGLGDLDDLDSILGEGS
jgi:UDP-glucose 4-epimerase